MDKDFNNWKYDNETFINGNFIITRKGNLFYKHRFIQRDENLYRDIETHYRCLDLKKIIT